jgi:predicted metal-dependent TIM-barrel fold hydrolase
MFRVARAACPRGERGPARPATLLRLDFFDPHLRAAALRRGDLEDLAFFGVAGALVVPSSDGPAEAPAVRRGWEALHGAVLRRMRRAEVAGWAAPGLHPRRIPRRGLEALLAELPHHLGAPGAIALGGVGLDAGGPREEEILARQLALAVELRRPIVVEVPLRDRAPLTRRILAILAEAEVPAGRAIVVGADSRTVKLVRACGHAAGLALSGPGDPIDEAVRVVRAAGPDGIVLASSAGDGAGDLLAIPRAAGRLRKAGLSAAVVRRVCGANARRLLGVGG